MNHEGDDKGLLMSFDIVWAPLGSMVGKGAGFDAHAQLSVPHFVDDPNLHTPEGGLNSVLDGRTLLLGILMTADEAPLYVAHAPTRQQLRTLLRLLAQDFRRASEDDLSAYAAGFLRERYNATAGLTALQRAVQLIPESVFCRGDLVVSLFTQARESIENRHVALEEAAQAFLVWQGQSTSDCQNEEMVFYCGLIALAYLARFSECNQVLVAHKPLIERSTLLRGLVPRLYDARPGHLEDMDYN